ncbi:MAG: ABC transporter substrate-binding protein [Holosporales bacterium]|jgi:phospholipid transport system substrate-binding protein|nr:ABC transporter substrate-binding protein [Holosporales bacterium]
MFRIFFYVITALCLFLGQTKALSPSPEKAQQFISDFGARAIAALTNPGITVEERQNRFAKLLDEGFDVETIGRFVLARHWSRLTEDQKKTFITVLRRMIVVNYAIRFKEFTGVILQVKSTGPAPQGGVNVTSLITPPRSGPVKVIWKMFPSKEGTHGFKIVDVVIDSVSTSVTQRSEFANVIQRLGGGMEAFLSDLEKRVQRVFYEQKQEK